MCTAGRPWNVRLAALVACRDFVRHLSRLRSGAAADGGDAGGAGAKPASAGDGQLAPEHCVSVAVFIPGDAPPLTPGFLIVDPALSHHARFRTSHGCGIMGPVATFSSHTH